MAYGKVHSYSIWTIVVGVGYLLIYNENGDSYLSIYVCDQIASVTELFAISTKYKLL